MICHRDSLGNPLELRTRASGRRGQDRAEFAGRRDGGRRAIPVAESIDHGLVLEFLWRSASFRSPGDGSCAIDFTHKAWFKATLALLLAWYYCDAAEILSDPWAARLPRR